jgi:hypothetical protein
MMGAAVLGRRMVQHHTMMMLFVLADHITPSRLAEYSRLAQCAKEFSNYRHVREVIEWSRRQPRMGSWNAARLTHFAIIPRFEAPR